MYITGCCLSIERRSTALPLRPGVLTNTEWYGQYSKLRSQTDEADAEGDAMGRSKVKPTYYCIKCDSYCKEIVEEYSKPMKSTLLWDKSNYTLTESNLATIESVIYCGECGAKAIDTRKRNFDGAV